MFKTTQEYRDRTMSIIELIQFYEKQLESKQKWVKVQTKEVNNEKQEIKEIKEKLKTLWSMYDRI